MINLILGIIATVVGILMTLNSYNNPEPSGEYTIYTGLIVVGVIWTGIGIYRLIRQKQEWRPSTPARQMEASTPAQQIEIVDESIPTEMDCNNCGEETLHMLAYKFPKRTYYLLCCSCATINYELEEEVAETLLSLPTDKDALAGCHYVRGIAYNKMGEAKKALDAYNLSISIEPSNPMPHMNLGVLYLEKEEYENALDCFKKSLELGENDEGIKALALSNMGQAYCGLGQYDRAEECQKESLAIDEAPTTFVELGMTYSSMGKIEDARDMFQRYLNWNGDPSDKLYPEEEVRSMMRGL